MKLSEKKDGKYKLIIDMNLGLRCHYNTDLYESQSYFVNEH